MPNKFPALPSDVKIESSHAKRVARLLQTLDATGAQVRLDRLRESIGPDIFDALISTYINRRLTTGYEIWDTNWQNLVTIKSDANMLDQHIVRMDELSNIDDLSKTGGQFIEITPPDDTDISYSVGGYGNLISVDFKTKNSDELGYFDKMGFNTGKAATRTFHKWLFVTNLQDNPTVDDSNSLFDDTNHSNDCDASSVGKNLNYANLASAYEKLRGQTDNNSEPIFINGAWIVCGTTNEINANTLINNDFNPDVANDERNFFKSVLKGYVISPYLGNDWYLFADADEFETFEVAFLDGQTEPELFMMDPAVSDRYFETKQTVWRIEWYFGGTWANWRGVVRGSTNN